MSRRYTISITDEDADYTMSGSIAIPDDASEHDVLDALKSEAYKCARYLLYAGKRVADGGGR